MIISDPTSSLVTSMTKRYSKEINEYPFRINCLSGDDFVVMGRRADGSQTFLSKSDYLIVLSKPNPEGFYDHGNLVINAPDHWDFAYITLFRKTIPDQELDLKNGQVINADLLERAFDKLSLLSAENATSAERAIYALPEIIGEEDVKPNLYLPPAEMRAGKVIGFDETGTVLHMYEDAEENAEQAAASAAEAKASAESALNSKVNAEAAWKGAVDAQIGANDAWGKAVEAQGKAQDAQAVAVEAQDRAEAAQTIAESKADEASASAVTAKDEADRAKRYADAAGAGIYTAREENKLFIHGQGASQSKPVELKVGVEEGKNEASIGYIRTMGLNLLTFDPVYFEGNPEQKAQSCRWNYICVEPKETYTLHFNEPMAIIRTEGRHSDGSRYTIHEVNFTDTLTFTDSVRKTVDIYIQSNTFFTPNQIQAQMEFGPRFTEYHEPRGKMYRLNDPDQIKVKAGDFLYKNADGFWYNGTAKLAEADQTVMESIEIPRGPFYLWCESHSHHYMQGLVTLEYTRDIGKALDEKADKADVYTKTEIDRDNKDLRMFADTTMFQTDSDGFPIPSQVAHVHVDKPYCEGALTYEGKEIPEGTVDFTVEPKDMAEKGIELKNALSAYDSSDWIEVRCTRITDAKGATITTEGGGDGIFYQSIKYITELNHKYYVATMVQNLSSATKEVDLRGNGFGGDTVVSSLEPNASTKLSRIAVRTVDGEYGQVQVRFVGSGAGDKFIVSHTMLIDITALSQKYPQYTDDQLKAILDASLPYISAQESKTLGGVITLENKFGDITKSSDWTVAGCSIKESGEEVEITFSEKYGTLKNIKYINGNHKIYWGGTLRTEGADSNVYMNYSKIGYVEYPFNGGIHITGEIATRSQFFYGTSRYNEPQSIIVSSFLTPPSSPIYVSKHGVQIDMTASLLDLWLSLNGYTTDDAKADWCNRHIPPFEGTFDLVLGMRNELTITAKCDGLVKDITFKKAISKLLIRSIYEEGENYIKFVDGTMIQWGNSKKISAEWKPRGNGYMTTININHNYKIPFSGIPSVAVTFLASSSTYPMNGTVDTSNTVLKNCRLHDTTTHVGTDTIDFTWQAIGRWK